MRGKAKARLNPASQWLVPNTPETMMTMTLETTMKTRRKRWRKSYVLIPFLTCFPLHALQEVDEGDLRTLDALLPANAGERRTLADIIFAKLESGETEEQEAAVIQKTHRGAR